MSKQAEGVHLEHSQQPIFLASEQAEAKAKAADAKEVVGSSSLNLGGRARGGGSSTSLLDDRLERLFAAVANRVLFARRIPIGSKHCRTPTI